MNKPEILCIGSALWDVIASASAFMETGHDIAGIIRRRPGGVALNVAVTLAKYNHRPLLLSTIGQDADGDGLIAVLAGLGVDCTHVTRTTDPTDCYLAIENPGGAIFGAIADCAGLERAGHSVIAPAVDGALGPWRGVAVVDGNLPAYLLTELPYLLPEAELVFVPASPGKANRLLGPLASGRAAIYINRAEAEILCAQPLGNSAVAARALIAAGARRVLVTDGANPASVATPEHCVTLQPPPVQAVSTTGAGDVVLAAHLAARGAQTDPDSRPALIDNLRAALDAAAVHITKANS